jgi:hypothetical protein
LAPLSPPAVPVCRPGRHLPSGEAFDGPYRLLSSRGRVPVPFTARTLLTLPSPPTSARRLPLRRQRPCAARSSVVCREKVSFHELRKCRPAMGRTRRGFLSHAHSACPYYPPAIARVRVPGSHTCASVWVCVRES